MAEKWECVVCGAPNPTASTAEREGMPCSNCASAWRVRAMAFLVLRGLELPLRPLPEAKRDWSWIGIGISDNAELAAELAHRFDYVNTFHHRFPRVDLTAPPEDLCGVNEFVVCSDVLEHVPPPAETAFAGLAALLRPGGVACVSVPLGGESAGRTVEHYPGLVSYDIDADGTVRWRDGDGTEHHDTDPEFHGGQGQTLAFRQWHSADFVQRLAQVGLAVSITEPDCPELGVPALADSGVYLARRD